MTSVEVYTGAWFGDRPLTLTFPDHWDVRLVGRSPGPALDGTSMRQRMHAPIGTARLSELARGKKSAAIIIDDISRPTPTPVLLPLVLEELEAGGMPLSAVSIVIAAGGHEPASLEDNLKKLGEPTASRVKWELHDPDGQLVHAGRSPSDIPLYINKTVMEAELKVGIGSLTPHDGAGFSGGSKILVPGVAGTETARYLHDYLKGAKYRGGPIDNDFRQELDVITGQLGLDFIVNVMLNHRREVAALFAGDRVLAHREGSRVASDAFLVEPATDVDVVIANTYPFDANLWFVPWGTWPLMEAAAGVIRIAIADGSQGAGGHRLKPAELSFLDRVWVRLLTIRPRHVVKQARHLVTSLARTKKRQNLEFEMLCPNISVDDMAKRFPAATLHRTWEDVLAMLEKKYADTPIRVAVYPCAPLSYRNPSGRADD